MQKSDITNRLKERGADGPCHRCGNETFSLLEGYSYIHLSHQLESKPIAGIPTVPLAHVMCDHCGVVSSHALYALGLLD